MYFAKPIFAFDVVYNRETTENRADYFKDEHELLGLVDNMDDNTSCAKGASMQEIATRRYRWDVITNKYVELYKSKS